MGRRLCFTISVRLLADRSMDKPSLNNTSRIASASVPNRAFFKADLDSNDPKPSRVVVPLEMPEGFCRFRSAGLVASVRVFATKSVGSFC